MHKIDRDKTAENMRAILTELGQRPGASELAYTAEAINATVALTLWAFSLEGRVVDGGQVLTAAAAIVAMPLATLLTGLGSDDDKENVHAGVHELLNRFSYDLHRLTGTFDEDTRDDDPDVFPVHIATRDVGDA